MTNKIRALSFDRKTMFEKSAQRDAISDHVDKMIKNFQQNAQASFFEMTTPSDFTFAAYQKGHKTIKLDAGSTANIETENADILFIELSGPKANPNIHFQCGDLEWDISLYEFLTISEKPARQKNILRYGSNEEYQHYRGERKDFLKEKLRGFLDAKDGFFHVLGHHLEEGIEDYQRELVLDNIGQDNIEQHGYYGPQGPTNKAITPTPDLKQKLQNWLIPLPVFQTPLDVAALCIKLQQQIETENWDALFKKKYKNYDVNYIKRAALAYLDDALRMLLHYSSSADAESFAQTFESPAYQNLVAKNARHLPLINRMEIFNRISSPNKQKFLEEAKKHAENITLSGVTQLRMAIMGLYREGQPEDEKFIIDRLVEQIEVVSAGLNTVDHPLIFKDNLKITALKDGPKSAHELALCFLLYSKLRIELTTYHGGYEDSTPQADVHIEELAVIADEIQNDIPYDMRRDMRLVDAQNVSDIFKTHYINETLLIALTHFYISQNKNKISAQYHAKLKTALDSLFYELTIETLQESSSVIIPNKSKAALDKMIRTVWEKNYLEYPSPSVKNVAAEFKDLITKSQTKAKAETILGCFETFRAQKPDNLEEVAIFHHQENKTIRDWRKKLFRRQKTEFLMGVAKNHYKDLRKLGLSAKQIKLMKEFGKIPEGNGLTVEHIIDREHGGTNHEHNFILMSAEINTLKDKLKRSQINYVPDSKNGHWIISWAPEKDENGRYPKILQICAADDNIRTINLPVPTYQNP